MFEERLRHPCIIIYRNAVSIGLQTIEFNYISCFQIQPFNCHNF
ncbi:ORF153 [Staphylococcus phage 37]|uniref:ORF153 n=1 Tax=Staphylococcus phage 37 TaxID=2936813 RepID=Q4ZCD6_9CAUD|nr:ORF153 [Staphylococcus phage 37]